MSVWSGLGLNYGHVEPDAYTTDLIDEDLTYLYDVGFRKLRVALPNYTASVATMTQQQYMVTEALNKGFYVIYGVCCVNPFTGAEWSAYKTYVTDVLAPWAESINNPNLELSLGNEEEGKNTGESAPDDATVQSDLRTLATAAQAIYTVGPIGYQASSTVIADWVSGGKGDMDKIGFNIYGTLAAFNTDVNTAFAEFGADFELTEWNVTSGYSSSPSETNNEKTIRDKLQILKDLNVSGAYFFTYNHTDGSGGPSMGNWGENYSYSILKEDRTEYRLAWQTLIGGRRYFIN